MFVSKPVIRNLQEVIVRCSPFEAHPWILPRSTALSADGKRTFKALTLIFLIFGHANS